MAAGDHFPGMSQVAAGGFLDIQPGGTDHVIIHNIHHEAEVELYWYDGVNAFMFEYHTGWDAWQWYTWHLKNGLYLRVKNTNAAAKWIEYDGIISDMTIQSAMQSIAAAGTLDIRPTAGAEWVIHNIAHEGGVELYWNNGSSSWIFDVDTGFGGWQCYEWHVKNGLYITVKNVESSAKYVQFDGVITK